ncbi:MAG TPA: hypothetical protein VIJ23_14345 [Mycobacterium sp.]
MHPPSQMDPWELFRQPLIDGRPVAVTGSHDRTVRGTRDQAQTLAADTVTRARNRLGPDHRFTRFLTRILPPVPPLAGI